MIQRLLTALLLILGLLAVLLLLPGAVALPVFALFLLGGAWEWSGFVAGAARWQRLAYVTVVGVLMGATYYLAAAAGYKLNTLFLTSVVFWVLALVPLARFPITVPDMAVRIAGILVLLPAWLAMARLLSASAAGPYWLLFFFRTRLVGGYRCLFYRARVRQTPSGAPGQPEQDLGGAVWGTGSCGGVRCRCRCGAGC